LVETNDAIRAWLEVEPKKMSIVMWFKWSSLWQYNHEFVKGF
jgi:hypothetical protein